MGARLSSTAESLAPERGAKGHAKKTKNRARRELRIAAALRRETVTPTIIYFTGSRQLQVKKA